MYQEYKEQNFRKIMALTSEIAYQEQEESMHVAIKKEEKPINDVYENLLNNLLNDISNIDNFLEYRSFSDTLRILLLIHILIANLEVGPTGTSSDDNPIVKILYIIYKLKTLNTNDDLNFYSNLKTDISNLAFENSDIPIRSDPTYSYDYNDGGDRDNGEVIQNIKKYITEFFSDDTGDEMDDSKADDSNEVNMVTPHDKANFTIAIVNTILGRYNANPEDPNVSGIAPEIAHEIEGAFTAYYGRADSDDEHRQIILNRILDSYNYGKPSQLSMDGFRGMFQEPGFIIQEILNNPNVRATIIALVDNVAIYGEVYRIIQPVKSNVQLLDILAGNSFVRAAIPLTDLTYYFLSVIADTDFKMVMDPNLSRTAWTERQALEAEQAALMREREEREPRDYLQFMYKITGFTEEEIEQIDESLMRDGVVEDGDEYIKKKKKRRIMHHKTN